jgi:hypothetical protein
MSGPLQTRRTTDLPVRLELSEDLLRIVQLAADLVNSVDRTGAREMIGDVDALSYVVSDHPWPLPPAREDDVPAVQALRSQLTDVFAAPAEPGSQQLLDELLATHPPTFEVAAAVDGSQALVIRTDDGTLAPTLGTQMSLALSAFLRDGGASRITTCDGTGCTNIAIERPDEGAFCSPHCRSRGARTDRPTSPRSPGGAPRAHRRP